MLKLKDFLQLYMDWVDDGALEPTILGFIRGSGLCDNLRRYSEMMGNGSNARELTEELMTMFWKDGLNTKFPFDYGFQDYCDKGMNSECHLNPKRIAWIRQQLKE